MDKILSQLQILQESSGKRLPSVVVSILQDNQMPKALVKSEVIANARIATKPRNGVDSLALAKNRQSARKTRTLPVGVEDNRTYQLNTALLGGTDYPVLTTVLGTAAGLASLGGGLIFAAAATGISLSKKSQRVLARQGDQVWSVEEIGKEKSGSGYKAVYVYALVIVDPYREQAPAKGWLIHEERYNLTLG